MKNSMNGEVEIWKDIPEWEKHYQASTFGRIKSLKANKERILKLCKDFYGYLNVTLSKDGKVITRKVHKLIAMTFHNHVPCGYELVVDHDDNNKENNYASNLKIITHRKNCSKDRKGGSSNYIGVTYHQKNKNWIPRIIINYKRNKFRFFH